MNNDLTLNKALAFFKAFKGDEIVFDTPHCGTYTDVYSDIHDVEISTLRVKVNKNYTNPDCVDKDNLTNVSIGSIRNILNNNYTSLELHEVDGKIISLQGFISKNKELFNHLEQQTLDKLLNNFELFYSQILLENSIHSDRKISRKRFNDLFIGI